MAPVAAPVPTLMHLGIEKTDNTMVIPTVRYFHVCTSAVLIDERLNRFVSSEAEHELCGFWLRLNFQYDTLAVTRIQQNMFSFMMKFIAKTLPCSL